VFVAESTVLRVLTAAGMHLPGLPTVREKRGKTPWPDWVELVPGQIYIYDFTHFTGLRGWCAIAVIDVVSRYWLSTVLAPEETWVQVETAFIAALEADGKGWLLEDAALAQELASGQVPDNDDRLPVLLAVSDNGPQMRSAKTAEFMAIARIAQHFGRPGTPNDQAWVESFFGHLKGEHPYLDAIGDPAVLRRMEALALPRAWVDMQARCIRFGDTKSGAQLRAIGAPAVRLLEALPVQASSRWVFPGERPDGHFVGLPKALARLCEKAGLEGVTVHVLRHTFAATAARTLSRPSCCRPWIFAAANASCASMPATKASKRSVRPGSLRWALANGDSSTG
jgi:transposase InsO family protein